ncbi:16S rRNA (guanine(966)-N(2))-methyltransferase RsmD [Tateyamaria sp.]|uniref:16S rRNA (guanine(966)-N(2))-methyltransferase RsmD n=1 Tax=Tateyamaria sp. TaxID=1929288 RepID=UPI00329E6211
MRIISGRWRGTPLVSVGKGDPGAHLRPTPDRVREALFSMLTSRGVIQDAQVLDLFAGTGALGFEALSRGAANAVFVENGRVGQKLINDNIVKLGARDQAKVLRSDATKLGEWPGAPFDLVFLDPPYGKGLGQRALSVARHWMTSGALVVWEEEAAMDAPEGFVPVDQRKFGTSHITLIERV